MRHLVTAQPGRATLAQQVRFDRARRAALLTLARRWRVSLHKAETILTRDGTRTEPANWVTLPPGATLYLKGSL